MLSSFVPKETLSSDSQTKKLVLLGTIDDKDAILQLEKTHFSSDILPISSFNLDAHNDVYYWGMNSLRQDLEKNPACKFNLIYPASETHIAKYKKHPTHMIVETPEMYSTIVKPYIETQKGDRMQWVRNILHHGAEKERVVFQNQDYTILPDMKWDGRTMESLYLVCIVNRDDIASVRDLRSEDVPFLERVQKSILHQVPTKYGISSDQLRLYIHYQPSFYHFHIHVVNADYTGVGHSILAGKAILLGEVIETLKLLKGGYSEKTIVYEMSESHDLWGQMKL
ncbi:hypothetical protein FOA43_004639 [Brettanomyces nanus]|uniref:M7GpppX diphosphatase n=1 Tax=Eeniella nana TaxID=13502 RepID=A0A875SC11_EENNA|nr:uncharacterized protein FOA43_004639 [Brettanomyces nanus]QPG77232.1 hypothetical protein FOA43_004639 [Brettanomyces nanus]